MVKFLPNLSAQYSFLKNRSGQRNLRILLRFFLFFLAMVLLYTVLFRWLMWYEDPAASYSWISSVYWVMVVMSTLGFGDIVFQSDLGKLFSILVLLSGSVFVLVLLPFMFIQFFYVPWMKSQEESRTPRRLLKPLKKHVILTGSGPVELSLVKMLERSQIPYVMIVPNQAEVLSLHDEGYSVIIGELDNPETYRNALVEQASMVVAFQADTMNSNIAFTVREISSDVQIVSLASFTASVDILELAGSNQVIQLGEVLGMALARRVGADARCHVIGEFGNLKIAEADAGLTPLVGRKLSDICLEEHARINIIGTWTRGNFSLAGPDTKIEPATVLMLAGTQQDIDEYDSLFCLYGKQQQSVIIIGGGRVGRATARQLAELGIDYRLIEKNPDRIRDPQKYILGDAAEIEVLEKAGIKKCTSIVITSRDDNVNVYLAIYCRRLRPDVQILVRANLDRNVSTLHRAGADFVMSYASMGANVLFNLLKRGSILLMTEGLDVFQVHVPASLVGESLASCNFRQLTGCNVVAIVENQASQTPPDPEKVLTNQMELILVGDHEAEERFYKQSS
jgi:voltage-gated potassium channel